MGHAHSSGHYANDAGQGEWNQTYPRPYKAEYFEGPSSLTFEPRIAPGLTGHLAQRSYDSRAWEEDDLSDIIRYPPPRFQKGGPSLDVPKVKVLPEHLPAGPRLRPTNNGNLLHNGGTISGRRNMLDDSDALTVGSHLPRRESQPNRSSSQSRLRLPNSHGESGAQALGGFSSPARHSNAEPPHLVRRDQNYEPRWDIPDDLRRLSSESEDLRESSRSPSPSPAPYTIIEESPAKSRIKARKRIKAPPPPAQEDSRQPGHEKSKSGMYQRRDSDPRPASAGGLHLSEAESGKESRKIRLFKTKSDVKSRGEHWHQQALREKASSTSNLVTIASGEMRHRQDSADRLATLPGPVTVFSSAPVKAIRESNEADELPDVSLHGKPSLILCPDPKFQREIRNAVQRKEVVLSRPAQSTESIPLSSDKRSVLGRQASFVYHEPNVRPSDLKRKESMRMSVEASVVPPPEARKQFYFGMPPGDAQAPQSTVTDNNAISVTTTKKDDITQEEIDRILQDFDKVATGNMSTFKSSKIKSTRHSPPPVPLPPSPQSNSKRPHGANSRSKLPTVETSAAEDDSSHDEISLSLRPTLPKKLLDLPKFSPSAAWRDLGAVKVPQAPREDNDESDVTKQSSLLQYSLTDSEKRVASLATTTQSRSDSSAEMNDVFEDRIGRRVRATAPARPVERSADSGISAGDANSPAPLLDLTPNAPSTPRRLEQPLAMSSPVPNHWVPEHDLNSDSSPNPMDHNDTIGDSATDRTDSVAQHLSGRTTPPKFTRKMFPAEESLAPEKGKNSPQTYNSLRKLKRSVSGITAALRSRSRSPDLSESGEEKESNNWLLSRSAPNSVLNGSDSQLLQLSSKSGNSNRSKQRIMYLPEYDSRRVVTAYDMQRSSSADPLLETNPDTRVTQSLDRASDVVRQMGPAQRAARKKGKKFTFQSTIRQEERRLVEAKLNKEAEEKEKKRVREMQTMQQVEEQFQKKRAKEKVTIRQQLRLLNLESSSRGENPVRMRSDGEEDEPSPTWPTQPADWDYSVQSTESSPSQPWDSSFSAPQSPAVPNDWNPSRDSKRWLPSSARSKTASPYSSQDGYHGPDCRRTNAASGSATPMVKERSFLGLKWRRSKSALSSSDSTLSRTRLDPEGAPAPRKETEMRREIIAASRVGNGSTDHATKLTQYRREEPEERFEKQGKSSSSQTNRITPVRYSKYSDEESVRSQAHGRNAKLNYSTSSADLSESYHPRRSSDSTAGKHRPTLAGQEDSRFSRHMSMSSVELSDRYTTQRKAESTTSSLSKTDKKSKRDAQSRNAFLTQELSEYRTEHRQYRDYRSPRQYMDQRRGSESGGESSLNRDDRTTFNYRSTTPSGASASRYSDNYRWDFAHGFSPSAVNMGRTSAASRPPPGNYGVYKSRARSSGSLLGHTDSDSDFVSRSRPVRR